MTWETEQEALDESPKAQLKRISKLLPKRVKKVVVDYAGGGDEGSVEGISYQNAVGVKVDYSPPTEVEETIENVITQFISGDWYNNDGGQGVITWDLETDTLFLEEAYNYTDTRTEYHEVDLNEE